MRMLKKARIALEVCDNELEEKAKEVAQLKLERQQKRQQLDELDSIVRLKQAEADMFQLKADEARREADRLQMIAFSKLEESEDDYANRYLQQRLNEAEAEKQYLVEKRKLQDHGSRPYQSDDN
uniref:Putative OBERON-like n=1 Tax=Solanum chacoense TaxID=4108 RepID=A0A0V0GPG3_SOLCH